MLCMDIDIGKIEQGKVIGCLWDQMHVIKEYQIKVGSLNDLWTYSHAIQVRCKADLCPYADY